MIDLKNIKEEIVEYYETVAQKIKDNYVPDFKHVVSTSFTDKGTRRNHCYCRACKNTFDADSAGYWARIDCPACGNKASAREGEHHSFDKKYTETSENGVTFLTTFAWDTNYKGFSRATLDWIKEEPEYVYKIKEVIAMSEDFGFLVYCNEAFLKSGSSAYVNYVKSALNVTPFNVTNPADLTTLQENYQKAVDKMNQITAEKEAKKGASKKGVLKGMQEAYKPREYTHEELFKNTHTILGTTYEERGATVVYKFKCLSCGEEWTDTVNNESITCPKCKNVTQEEDGRRRKPSYGYSQSLIIFENTNLPDNDLLIRFFDKNASFSRTDFSVEVKERNRVFCGKEKSTYQFKNGVWTKAREDSVRTYYRQEAMQTKEEIIDIIKNSALAHSGYLEAKGLDDRYKRVAVHDLDYIQYYYKHPKLELLTKSNIPGIVSSIISQNRELNDDAETVWDILNVSKKSFQIARDLDVSSEYLLNEIEALYKIDNNIDNALAKEVLDLQLNIQQLIFLNRLGISLRSALNYLQNAYDHQCIEKREACTIWTDYLRMAELLKYDLKDKYRKYPTSLKKEHDVAMFAFKEIEQAVDKAIFAKQAEINKEYEYSLDKLFVIVPKTPEDVITEATAQKNCLRSYITRIKNGDTLVAFIRKKDDPDTSYVTVEICNNRVVQVKGFCNSNPMNKELKTFMEHWAKAKAFRL